MNDRPALLGSLPLFETKLRFANPVLPSFEEVADEIRDVLASGNVTKGKHLDLLEESLAKHFGVKHAIAVSSCTAGLMLTHQALEVREAVLPAFTFMATASSLVWAGARPVFADVCRTTMNLEANLTERALGSQTDAIVATHNFGNPAEISELQELASRRGLRLIFDAAHGMGSHFRGAPIGSHGDAHVFSLSATKLLVAGEGGVVTTNHDELANKLRMGREYGNDGAYDSAFAGINARLPEISALIARHSLKRLEQSAERRNMIAAAYTERLRSLPGVSVQTVQPHNRSSYNYFAMTINEAEFGLTRDQLAMALDAENIETRRYYDPPTHRHTAYRKFAAATDLRESDYLAANTLCLPIWSSMEDEFVWRVSHAIARAHRYCREIQNQGRVELAAACASSD